MPKWPRRGAGDYPYIGRRFNVEKSDHETTEEPAEVLAGSKEAARFIELCVRDGDLLPADEATARVCGVSFVPLKRIDGEWVPAPKPQPAAVRKAE